jgi:hypothetical protein
MATVYDSWSPMQKRHYNSDGSMREEYKQQLLSEGASILDIFAMEARKQEEVRQFEEREQLCLAHYGETFSAITERRRRESEAFYQRNERQRLALEEGADISELPEHIEPDDYYDYHAGYPG